VNYNFEFLADPLFLQQVGASVKNVHYPEAWTKAGITFHAGFTIIYKSIAPNAVPVKIPQFYNNIMKC
jgi:hypothetical protein